MSGCAVMASLHSHLSNEDRKDALEEHAQSIVDGWMQKNEKILEAWEHLLLNDGFETTGHDVAKALIGDSSDKACRAEALLDYFEQKLRDVLIDSARSMSEVQAERFGYED